MVLQIIGLCHMCHEPFVEIIYRGHYYGPIRLSRRDFERLAWDCRFESDEELIGLKLYKDGDDIYILNELCGDVQGDTDKEIVGKVIGLSSDNNKCLWQIGTDKAGSPTVKVEMTLEETGNAHRAMGCIFPWDIKGRPAIYTKGHAYLMQIINRNI